MDLRCNKAFTLPSPFKSYERGKAYHLEVEAYDVKKYPWLKFFDAPAPKAEASKKGKRDDDLLK